MLLLIVKGACSYESLRTYNNTTYSTFKETCQACGLLGDDKEWLHAFDEASAWATQLRQLFVTMLLYCDITNEYMFFDRVWKFLADDIQYNIQKALNCLNYQMPENDLRNELLDRLAILFNKSGGNIHDFNLPQKTNSIQQAGVNRLVEEEMSYDIDHLLDESEVLISQLNAQQFDAFTAIVDNVLNSEPKFYFVSGYGGTGKTFLWNAIVSCLRSQKKCSNCCFSPSWWSYDTFVFQDTV